MSRADCEDLVLRAVTQAILRDGSSGGCCRMAIITKVQQDVQTCPFLSTRGLVLSRAG